MATTLVTTDYNFPVRQQYITAKYAMYTPSTTTIS